MKRALSLVIALAVVSALVRPTTAQACVVTVNFFFGGSGGGGDPDPANGTGQGWFTFDSSLIPAGGGSGAPTDAYFSWLGQTWTESNTWFAFNFNSDGSVQNWVFASYPLVGQFDGDVFPWFNLLVDENNSTPEFTYMEINYATHDSPTLGYFSILPQVAGYTVTVPEPGTLALFGVGLLPLGLCRMTGRSRFRRKNGRIEESIELEKQARG